MEIKLNSITSIIYRWFYATKIMPKSLCPYFWKVVLMYIFLLPYALLSLPTSIYYKIKDKNFYGDSEFFLEKPFIGILLYTTILISLILLFSLSIFWIDFEQKSFFRCFQVVGILLWIGIILAVIITTITKYYEDKRYRDWYNDEEKKVKKYMLIEYIKAFYNKHCPKIDWK